MLPIQNLFQIIPNTSNGRSSRYLHNADFIKLKNISLGYSLPKSLIKKILLQNVRIYVSADKLDNLEFG
mgnify:CR=1 FL=1